MNRFRYIWFFLVMKFWGLFPDLVPVMRLRGILLKPVFKKCGRNFQICSHSMILSPENVSIGNDVYIAYGSWVQGGGGVKFEDEVMLGPYSILASSNHTLQDKSFRFGTPRLAPIVLRRGSWTGSHVTVVAGVEIGEGSAVAANSAVTIDVPPGVVVGGVPARKISD